MEKLILVIYVGVRQFMDNDAIEYLDKISQIFGSKIKDDVLYLVVPKRDTTEITIDCINPKLLNKKQYKKVEESVKKLKRAADEIMKKGED